MDYHTWTHQFCSTSEDIHTSSLFGLWMQSRGPTKRGWIRGIDFQKDSARLDDDDDEEEEEDDDV